MAKKSLLEFLVRRLVLISLVMVAGFCILIAADTSHNESDDDVSGAKKIEGVYERSNGLSYNLELTLRANGNYTARWHSCLSQPGTASGTWSLSNSRITFKPAKEDESIRGRLKTLYVLSDWILLPTEERDRELYEKKGITTASCFQRVEKGK